MIFLNLPCHFFSNSLSLYNIPCAVFSFLQLLLVKDYFFCKKRLLEKIGKSFSKFPIFHSLELAEPRVARGFWQQKRDPTDLLN